MPCWMQNGGVGTSGAEISELEAMLISPKATVGFVLGVDFLVINSTNLGITSTTSEHILLRGALFFRGMIYPVADDLVVRASHWQRLVQHWPKASPSYAYGETLSATLPRTLPQSSSTRIFEQTAANSLVPTLSLGRGCKGYYVV